MTIFSPDTNFTKILKEFVMKHDCRCPSVEPELGHDDRSNYMRNIVNSLDPNMDCDDLVHCVMLDAESE